MYFSKYGGTRPTSVASPGYRHGSSSSPARWRWLLRQNASKANNRPVFCGRRRRPNRYSERSSVLKDRQISLRFPGRMEWSEAHRAIIDLVYYHGQSTDEVAQILGIPQDIVQKLMLNARGRMGAYRSKERAYTPRLLDHQLD